MIKSLLTALLIFATLLAFSQTNRSYDGFGNNSTNPSWGSEGSYILRLSGNGYADGISVPSGNTRPNPRYVSNAIYEQNTFIPNTRGLSDFGWAFGQFIDHEITLVDDNPSEFISVNVPPCDVHFDPGCTGAVSIFQRRSKYDPGTGLIPGSPRMHINDITSFIDASAVYGSNVHRADWLRSFQDGKLKTSAGNQLPYNTTTGEYGDPIDPTAPFMVIDITPKPTKFFIAGDIRANEQPTLMSMHTLFMREHNTICDSLKTQFPGWNDEKLYQRARKIVGAQLQAIVYEEWLPALGVTPTSYVGYDNTVNPGIANAFSAAAFRVGHTLVNGQLIRLQTNGDTLSFGSIDLRNAFFNTDILRVEGGIEPILQGAATQRQQQFDTHVMDDLRNFLFGAPGAGGLDLVAININRARERGLMDYSSVRSYYGLPAITAYSQITTDTSMVNHLTAMFNATSEIDPWVGMLAEDIVPGSAFGLTVKTVLEDQFTRLRDGDRFYYEIDSDFTFGEIQKLKATRLSDLILRNTSITNIQDNVFYAKAFNDVVSIEMMPFSNISHINITAYPNPVQNNFILNIISKNSNSAVLEVIDLAGKLILSKNIELEQGENNLNFSLSNEVASGVYNIIIKDENGVGQLKLIKQ